MTIGPIADGELAGLFAGLARYAAVGLAVSGGPDSTALMHLFMRWRAMGLVPRATVLTVDHGLRPEATAEAQAVRVAAEHLGFSCLILRWTGEKPETGLQEAAREARYRLLTMAALAHGLEAIVTAHTEDDQAETLLMRLARGSGLDGLSGIPGRALLGGVPIVRPLLAIPKARLMATLEAASIPFITDPSNADLRFERARLRAQRPTLEGLGLTSAGLGRSARRLERARLALEAITDDVAQASVEVSPAGVATVDLDRLGAAPDEVAVRMVQRLTLAAGGDGVLPSLAKVEALAEWLKSARSGGRTLGRAEISVRSHGGSRCAVFFRETGRASLPVSVIAAGEIQVWDGRFQISLAAGCDAVEIRAGGLLPDRARDAAREMLLAPGSDAAPFALRDTTLVATPLDPGTALEGGLSFRFLGLSTVFGEVAVPKPKNKPKAPE
jgi:tRNA(Ile)-lysidine synthase